MEAERDGDRKGVGVMIAVPGRGVVGRGVEALVVVVDNTPR